MSLLYNPFDRMFRHTFDDYWGNDQRGGRGELERSRWSPSHMGRRHERTKSDRMFCDGGEVCDTADKYCICMDVSDFRPDELKVNVVGKYLVIEGHHDERDDDYGTVQRTFVRRYLLPEDIDQEMIRSNMKEDGKLQIEAPKMTPGSPNSRPIPIQSM